MLVVAQFFCNQIERIVRQIIQNLECSLQWALRYTPDLITTDVQNHFEQIISGLRNFSQPASLPETMPTQLDELLKGMPTTNYYAWSEGWKTTELPTRYWLALTSFKREYNTWVEMGKNLTWSSLLITDSYR